MMINQETAAMLSALQQRIAALESMEYSHYKGDQAGDYTTTTLPQHGDYGFQTTDNELQMNCNGTIRAVGMAAV